MSILAQERTRIANAIRSAEARTSGEIVCVLARTSSDATALPVVVAAAIALALPWLLMAFTDMTVHRILLLQIVVFFALLVPLCLPRVRVALMPRGTRRAIAHRVAMEQFSMRGIARTKDRCGILIFVSLAERYARIIADDGIAARVPQAEWQLQVRHGGLHGTTGSECRDDCYRKRSGDSIAANWRTARRERPSRVASVGQDPNSAVPDAHLFCEFSTSTL